MDNLSRYAEIPQLRKGVAFSDPLYGPDVWCQYRKAFVAREGWAMRLDSTRSEDGIVDFTLLVGRRSALSGLKVGDLPDGNASITHYQHHMLEEKDIGIDSARVFVGSLDGFEKFAEEGSVHTGADGLFGVLHAVTCKGEDEPAGFILMGALDEAVTDEKSLFQTLLSSFDAHEITQERFEQITDKKEPGVRRQLASELAKAAAAEKKAESLDKPRQKRGDMEL